MPYRTVPYRAAPLAPPSSPTPSSPLSHPFPLVPPSLPPSLRRFNDIGYQSSDIPDATPFMDSIAEQGVKLTQYYGQEMCTPARAALMSGRWPSSTNFADTQITQWSTNGLPLRFDLMPSKLQEFGYATVGLGKWNLGHCNEAYLPWSRG